MSLKICSIEGCEAKLKARGRCNRHYRRWLKERAQPCSIEGCDKPVKARGWCNRHWLRWDRHGDPLGGGVYREGGALEDRFWRHVQKTDGCWFWQAALNDSGYGIISYKNRHIRAHRFSWEAHNGKIPDGLQIDHQCRNRQCVNPAHLRIATPKQNAENTTARKGAISKYRGVTWSKLRGKWFVQATHNGRPYSAGYFDNEEEANKAAIALRNELFTYNSLDRRVA